MNTTRAGRRARGQCADCAESAKDSRCAVCREKWRKYKAAYRARIKAGQHPEPAFLQPTKQCEHCGAACRKRFCSQSCYRDSGAAAAAARMGSRKLAERRTRQPTNPHRNYDLGVSNLRYTRRMACQCSKCQAARAEDPAKHAAFVESVARAMGVPVATGPSRPPVCELPRDEWLEHFDRVHAANREVRKTGAWQL